MSYVCLLTCALAIVSAAPASAQLHAFQAELTCGRCSSYMNINVELTDSSRQPVASGPVSQNGGVHLNVPREGTFLFSVRTISGELLHEEIVQVGRLARTLRIDLGERGGALPARPPSGTVSVSRLKHKLDKKAHKEYRKAEERMLAGDVQGSLRHLQKAVEIDPSYMEAHNNLGSRYIMVGDLRSAHAAFVRALELDPASTLAQVNLAIVLLTMGDAKGSEAAARHAVQLDPTDLKAKYMLGLSLYGQRAYTREATDMLNKAREAFPNASMALAVMQAKAGELNLARRTLTEFIEQGKGEHKARAEQILASLK